MKKRTKAQRSAAAKLAWQNRRLKLARKPASTYLAKVNFGGDVSAPPATAPTTVGATQEGEEYFVTFSHDGSVFRHRLSHSAMRKLGLDCLTLVG